MKVSPKEGHRVNAEQRRKDFRKLKELTDTGVPRAIKLKQLLGKCWLMSLISRGAVIKVSNGRYFPRAVSLSRPGARCNGTASRVSTITLHSSLT